MKRNILLICFILLIFQLNAQTETDLYDKNGESPAYLYNLVIYSTDGVPYAYLNYDGIFHIYGFNGKHLGYYENGFILDHSNKITGFLKGTLAVIVKSPPIRGIRQILPLKSLKEMAPMRPMKSHLNYYSEYLLIDFIKQGTATPPSKPQATNKRQYNNFVPPVDLNLMAKAMAIKQAKINKAKIEIQAWIDSTDNSQEMIKKNQKDTFTTEQKKYLAGFKKDFDKINSPKIDFSQDAIRIWIVNWLKRVNTEIKSWKKFPNSVDTYPEAGYVNY